MILPMFVLRAQADQSRPSPAGIQVVLGADFLDSLIGLDPDAAVSLWCEDEAGLTLSLSKDVRRPFTRLDPTRCSRRLAATTQPIEFELAETEWTRDVLVSVELAGVPSHAAPAWNPDQVHCAVLPPREVIE